MLITLCMLISFTLITPSIFPRDLSAPLTQLDLMGHEGGSGSAGGGGEESLVYLPGFPAVPRAWEALTHCCVLSLPDSHPLLPSHTSFCLTRSTATLLPGRNQALAAGSRVGVFPDICRNLPQMSEPSGVLSPSPREPFSLLC